MKGFAAHQDTDDDLVGPGDLAPWEALVVDAVGHVIDFWRFKRNQGRLWALLYLRRVPLGAPELGRALGLSKGAVSMLVRDLQQWGVITRVRAPADANWRWAAETDLLKMLGRVIADRELDLVQRVRADLERAEALAREDRTIASDVLDRIVRIRRLAQIVEKAIGAFLTTARLDLGGAVGLLDRLVPGSVRRRKE